MIILYDLSMSDVSTQPLRAPCLYKFVDHLLLVVIGSLTQAHFSLPLMLWYEHCDSVAHALNGMHKTHFEWSECVITASITIY